MKNATTVAVVLSAALGLVACGGNEPPPTSLSGVKQEAAVAASTPSPTPSPTRDGHALEAQALAKPKPPMPVIEPQIGAANKAEAAEAYDAAVAALDAFRRNPELLTTDEKTVATFDSAKAHMSDSLYNEWALPAINTYLASSKNKKGGSTGTAADEAYSNLAGLLTLVYSDHDRAAEGTAGEDGHQTAAGYDAEAGAHGPITVGKVWVSDLTSNGSKGYMVTFEHVTHDLNVIAAGDAAKRETIRLTTKDLAYQMFKENGRWLVHVWRNASATTETLPR